MPGAAVAVARVVAWAVFVIEFKSSTLGGWHVPHVHGTIITTGSSGENSAHRSQFGAHRAVARLCAPKAVQRTCRNISHVTEAANHSITAATAAQGRCNCCTRGDAVLQAGCAAAVAILHGNRNSSIRGRYEIYLFDVHCA